MTLDHDSPGARDQQAIRDWAERLDDLDYYQILGLPRTFDALSCQRAYHEFATRFHPDTRPWEEPGIVQAMVRVFQRGVEAYRVLSSDALRRRYEQALRRGELRLQDLTPPPPVDLPSELPTLHVRCRSAGAKLAAQRAARSYQRDEHEKAIDALQAALGADGGTNPDIERCIDALRTLVARSG